MCDTLGFVASDTLRFFAKNSDRHPSEPQYFTFASGTLDCPREPELPKYAKQYETLTRAHATLSNPYRALVSRPSWIWGAEMGVNEWGLSIGNEAVFSRIKEQEDGLLGMDILRLALHNCKSAAEAVELILSLLATYGQGGDGAFEGKLFYSNSFLIADPTSLILLETAGDRWAVKTIDDLWTISNAYSLGVEYDRADELSVGKHFSRSYANRFMEFFSKGNVRAALSTTLLEEAEPTWSAMRDVLLYNQGSIQKLDRSMKNITLDASFPTPTRTTTSIVVELSAAGTLAWCCLAPIPTYHPFIPTLITAETLQEKSPFGGYEEAVKRIAITETIKVAPPEMKEECARAARALEVEFSQRLGAWIEERDQKKIAEICKTCRADALAHEASLAERFAVAL